MSARPPQAATARTRALAELTAGVLQVPAGIEITDVTLDSRAVRPGALFLACRGLTRHGVSFAREAAAQGARAILFDDDVPAPEVGAAVFVAGVPRLGTHLGTIADRFFDAPSQSLAVTGVTGTNGKTTCAYLLAQAFTLCGRPAAYIGTIGVGFPARLASSAHTTSDVVTVHRQLAELKSLGAECVAMEVSSHALELGRVAGVRFRAAAFTNLTRDHLDLHGSMQAYGAAKARLFETATLAAQVINVDDAFGLELAQAAAVRAREQLIATTRLGPSGELHAALAQARFVRAAQVTTLPAGQRLTIESSWGSATTTVPLLGEFNVDNVLTVLGVLLGSGIGLAAAAEALARCVAPPGRLEAIACRDGRMAIVDYAHTPDALEKALRAVRAHCRGRLTVVFGCGGDRDPGKRPLLGRIAVQSADAVIITDDNPRGEDPHHIVRDILGGIHAPYAAELAVEHDRARAIRDALAASSPGDVVLIAGKGHEDYQIYGTERRAFSDQAVVRECLGAQA